MREGLDALEDRTRQFAVDVMRLAAQFHAQHALWDSCRQLSRAASSVSVNHRTMRRARSLKEFAAKLQIVNEEIDEAAAWLSFLSEVATEKPAGLPALCQEALELRAIFARARATTRKRLTGS